SNGYLPRWVKWAVAAVVAVVVVVAVVALAAPEVVAAAVTMGTAVLNKGAQVVQRVGQRAVQVASRVSQSKGVKVVNKGVSNATSREPIIVTEDIIRAAMKDAPLKTQQGAVNLPAIQRYVTRLEGGEIAPAIKVDNGIIVDGNHRYIAGRIFGKEPLQVPGAGGRPNSIIDWSKLKIDPFDWGNK
ncbi:hypothetical protein, partial [Clostridium thailandense]|uniref:hypothetical protein n=1 Tax=Clostridium thailandense TaxID=2794346 RepID=UPI003989DE9A